MARTRIQEHNEPMTTVCVTMPKALRAWIDLQATQEKRSRSAQIAMLVQSAQEMSEASV
jgi:hypothetical protein